MSYQPDSDTPDRMIHIRMPHALHRKLRVLVALNDTSIQEWVLSKIQTAIEKEEKGKKQ